MSERRRLEDTLRTEWHYRAKCFPAFFEPTKKRRRQHWNGGLRLDFREFALKPAKSWETAIVLGDAGRSPLLSRIESGDEDQVMPPPKSHKTVTPEQRAKLRQWINKGATYEKHPSFILKTGIVTVYSRYSGGLCINVVH
jgi:hypothetical protein